MNRRPPAPAGQSFSEALTEHDIAALASFRFALRCFTNFSDAVVKPAGVTTQQYQMLLAIRAQPERALSIKELAQQMLLKPNGAVQLVNRLVLLKLVKRRTSTSDRRGVLVTLTDQGDRLIARLAAEHLLELMRQRPLLVESLRQLKSISE
jgi:DNA-binding MarR family transcriptional regulator